MQDLFDNSDEFTFTPELLCTKVFSFLRDAIIQGKIEPGEKLNVSFIASKLGLSRSPVREAIRILEAHNFVETLPQKGAYVREVTCEEISELFVVEKSLLSVAVELTTLSMDEKKRQELKSIIQELQQVKKTKKIEAIIDASRHFHNFVATHCGNKLLIKVYESLLMYRERPYLILREVMAEDYDGIIQEPIDVSMTMLKGDAGQARSKMEGHMDNARERTLKAVSRKKRSNLDED